MKNKDISIVNKFVNDLIPYINNAMTHSEIQINKIAASIEKFGFNNPILVDGKNTIIAGHGRLVAAKKLGMQEVPVIYLNHLTDDQKKAYIIADNKLSEESEWDFSMLADEIESIAESGIDATVTGFSDDELDSILNEKTELTQKEEIIKPIKKTRILISIPVGIMPDKINEILKELSHCGAEVDYSGN